MKCKQKMETDTSVHTSRLTVNTAQTIAITVCTGATAVDVGCCVAVTYLSF